MLAPGAVYLFIQLLYPHGGRLWWRLSSTTRARYVRRRLGRLSNFEFLFKTNDAWLMTRNTLVYNLVFILLGTVLAITIAIILNEIHSKAAKQVYQTVILIPYLISMVVVSYLAFAF